MADQLTVEPNPALPINAITRNRKIEMSRQEIAVALSHIGVWEKIASSNISNTLVLEDDVFMNRGFARKLDSLWNTLNAAQETKDFDLLFLAFEIVNSSIEKDSHGLQRLQSPGIWEASGYVISNKGAQKLLELLPVRGPVDLWMNLQFKNLKVLIPDDRIISQRVDEPSTNQYSVLPVLSQTGVLIKEKPLISHQKKLLQPIICIGKQNSGLTSLAIALSTLGYTCLSDVEKIPDEERTVLFMKKRNRKFNAYVNAGISIEECVNLAAIYPNAKFIATSDTRLRELITPGRVLQLFPNKIDKWLALSQFLEVNYPVFPYPYSRDIGQRTVGRREITTPRKDVQNLRWDKSPWILTENDGLFTPKNSSDSQAKAANPLIWNSKYQLPNDQWRLRDDTFPSNLALFTPKCVVATNNELQLTLREKKSAVRDYASGALASTNSFIYGEFMATLCPAKGSGLVTGLFLHRNSPYQEIDIEFLGKDTTKMLINVFFNPGIKGTKLEYGYRGTPVIINLGFDAAKNFHEYTISWHRDAICWLVDGKEVFQRQSWGPTPIPNQPLEFNLNLWHSRSSEFAGHLDASKIPALTIIKSIKIQPQRSL